MPRIPEVYPDGTVALMHLGIVRTDGLVFARPNARLAQRTWPHGFIAFGDSFEVWGEHRATPEGVDGTIHVVVPLRTTTPSLVTFEECRERLRASLHQGERLANWASTSDPVDWSAGNVITVVFDAADRASIVNPWSKVKS